MAEDSEAVDPRERQIAQDDVKGPLPQDLERVRAVRRFDHAVARLFEARRRGPTCPPVPVSD